MAVTSQSRPKATVTGPAAWGVSQLGLATRPAGMVETIKPVNETANNNNKNQTILGVIVFFPHLDMKCHQSSCGLSWLKLSEKFSVVNGGKIIVKINGS
jgi:hypothetical protein